jgi:4-hydroxybenzoate polyprenyltransferase
MFQPLRYTLSFLSIIWGFIESDFVTFAVPNSAFGVFGAFASAKLLDYGLSTGPSITQTLQRLPLILSFKVSKLLVFDLTNQRTVASVTEDCINKPWRPIPQGSLRSDGASHASCYSSYYSSQLLLNAWQQGVFIHILTWLYSDLGGGDEVFVRELIIAIAYGFLNSGSLTIAVGPEYSLSSVGITWTVIVSCVILTTMQLQDLKDQKGDLTRGRETIALSLGKNVSRISIACFVSFWSCMCWYLWSIGLAAFSITAVAAIIVVIRVVLIRTPEGDARTWRLWCLWHASLYMLPALTCRS